MIRELLTRLTAAGANGVNLSITQQGDRALVIIKPALNPMPYSSDANALKIHAAMQTPLVINAELDELDTELHIVVGDYLASFESGMQTSNVNEVVTQHTAASLTELTSKKAASASKTTEKKPKKQAQGGSVSASQSNPAPAVTQAEPAAMQPEQPAKPAVSMEDFEALFASTGNDNQ